MEPAYSADAAVFARYLDETGQAYLLLDDSGVHHAHLRFTGQFQRAAVVWDCHFVTLTSELERLGRSSLRSFIEIGAAGARGIPIRVGLNLERIEQPDILKMIIMIRNYKRLQPGRQEFGAAFAPG